MNPSLEKIFKAFQIPCKDQGFPCQVLKSSVNQILNFDYKYHFHENLLKLLKLYQNVYEKKVIK